MVGGVTNVYTRRMQRNARCVLVGLQLGLRRRDRHVSVVPARVADRRLERKGDAGVAELEVAGSRLEREGDARSSLMTRKPGPPLSHRSAAPWPPQAEQNCGMKSKATRAAPRCAWAEQLRADGLSRCASIVIG